MTIPCSTVGQLRAALDSLPNDAPLAVLYDWGADVKRQVVVRGPHVCDSECDPIDCPLASSIILDIDPRPARDVVMCGSLESARAAVAAGRKIGQSIARSILDGCQ